MVLADSLPKVWTTLKTFAGRSTSQVAAGLHRWSREIFVDATAELPKVNPGQKGSAKAFS